MLIKGLSSGSHGNAYVLSDGETNILIDCGISYKEIQKKSNFMNFDGVLISHEHKDHCKALNDLLHFGVNCYVNDSMYSILDKRFNLIQVNDLIQFRLGSFNVLPFPLVHDVQNTGYLLSSNKLKETVLYITDTAYCKYNFKSVHYYIIECNYNDESLDYNVKANEIQVSLRNRIKKNHMSLKTLKKFFQNSDLSVTKDIYLIHSSQSNSNIQAMSDELYEQTKKNIIIF